MLRDASLSDSGFNFFPVCVFQSPLHFKCLDIVFSVVEEVKVEEPVDQLLQEDLGIMGQIAFYFCLFQIFTLYLENF